jgi:hypothetical protein
MKIAPKCTKSNKDSVPLRTYFSCYLESLGLLHYMPEDFMFFINISTLTLGVHGVRIFRVSNGQNGVDNLILLMLNK